MMKPGLMAGEDLVLPRIVLLPDFNLFSDDDEDDDPIEILPKIIRFFDF
jgi:hypothetical protein